MYVEGFLALLRPVDVRAGGRAGRRISGQASRRLDRLGQAAWPSKRPPKRVRVNCKLRDFGSLRAAGWSTGEKYFLQSNTKQQHAVVSSGWALSLCGCRGGGDVSRAGRRSPPRQKSLQAPTCTGRTVGLGGRIKSTREEVNWNVNHRRRSSASRSEAFLERR